MAREKRPNKPRVSATKMISLRLPTITIKRVKEAANKDYRKFGPMIDVLLREALARRRRQQVVGLEELGTDDDLDTETEELSLLASVTDTPTGEVYESHESAFG